MNTMGACAIAAALSACAMVPAAAAAQQGERWAVVGHAQPVATLTHTNPDGTVDPRTWSLGADGLVVAWLTDAWFPLAWRRVDGARAIGGLYDGDVVVETPDGVLRLDPSTLLNSSASSAYPGAVLPSPAGLHRELAEHAVTLPARVPVDIAPIAGGIALLEAGGWCNVTVDDGLRVQCHMESGREVLASARDVALVCQTTGEAAVLQVVRLADGEVLQQLPAPSCPASAIRSQESIAAVVEGTAYTWDGAALREETMPGVAAATPPLGFTRERLVLLEQFDGTCATRRRAVYRLGQSGREPIWRGECEGEERMHAMVGDDGALLGVVLVQAGGDGIVSAAFSLGGRPEAAPSLAMLPSARAIFRRIGGELVVADPLSSADDAVVLYQRGTLELVRDGGTLHVTDDGESLAEIVVFGSEAVLAMAQTVVATPGIAARVAVPGADGVTLLPNARFPAGPARTLLEWVADDARDGR